MPDAVVTDKIFPPLYSQSKTSRKICVYAVIVILVLIQICTLYFNDGDFHQHYIVSTTKKTIAYWTRLIDSDNRTDGEIREYNTTSEKKTILFWTPMFGDDLHYFGNGDVFRGCEVSACQLTSDRNLMKLDEFDALVFHPTQIKIHDLPSVRSPKQKYVFDYLESPLTYDLNRYHIPDGFFNWTMTYRRDSSIPRVYGHIIDPVTNDVVYPVWARKSNRTSNNLIYEKPGSKGNNVRFKGITKLAGKTKAAAWFVSNCKPSSHRDLYVDELKKYINIDIYGRCGHLSCKPGGDQCNQMLESKYYFYISFENSLCQDYVTEKLYKILQYNVVPIVYGGANYSEFAPPHSYINVADFESPKHLAEYLNHLMNNPVEYAEFFWWKKYNFHIDLGHSRAVCKLCEVLHNAQSLASSYISDIKKWWFEGACQNSLEYLKKIIPQ